MNFLLFLVYYFLCTLIFICLGFIIYKLFLKKIIAENIALNISDFFKSEVEKSFTDINLEDKEDHDEKIPTYF